MCGIRVSTPYLLGGKCSTSAREVIGTGVLSICFYPPRDKMNAGDANAAPILYYTEDGAAGKQANQQVLEAPAQEEMPPAPGALLLGGVWVTPDELTEKRLAGEILYDQGSALWLRGTSCCPVGGSVGYTVPQVLKDRVDGELGPQTFFPKVIFVTSPPFPRIFPCIPPDGISGSISGVSPAYL